MTASNTLSGEAHEGRPLSSAKSVPLASSPSWCNPDETSVPDAELLHQLAAGDKDAFGTIYRRHRQPLLDFLGKRYPRLDVNVLEDVVQEVFLHIWLKRYRLRALHHLLNYLISMARNQVADKYRRSAAIHEKMSVNVPSISPLSDHVLSEAEVADQINRALSRLAKSQLLVLQLAQDGCSAQEIADTVQCTEKAVRLRLARARKQMRVALSLCGSSCVLDQHHPAQCPAQKENFHCLKRLYLKSLQSR